MRDLVYTALGPKGYSVTASLGSLESSIFFKILLPPFRLNLVTNPELGAFLLSERPFEETLLFLLLLFLTTLMSIFFKMKFLFGGN